MENAADEALRPLESMLCGDAEATRGTTFGFGWFDRTYGIGALQIEWTSSGLRSISITPTSSMHDRYLSSVFKATKTQHWVRLLDNEYVSGVDVGVSNNRVVGVRFHTNLRPSQWFGAKADVVHRLTPPPGYFVHMIHGRCHNNQCLSFGAYYLPLTLRTSEPTGCVSMAPSDPIGAPWIALRAITLVIGSPWFE